MPTPWALRCFPQLPSAVDELRNHPERPTSKTGFQNNCCEFRSPLAELLNKFRLKQKRMSDALRFADLQNLFSINKTKQTRGLQWSLQSNWRPQIVSRWRTNKFHWPNLKQKQVMLSSVKSICKKNKRYLLKQTL